MADDSREALKTEGETRQEDDVVPNAAEHPACLGRICAVDGAAAQFRIAFRIVGELHEGDSDNSQARCDEDEDEAQRRAKYSLYGDTSGSTSTSSRRER